MFINIIIDWDYIKKLSIDNIILDQITNIKINNIKVKNIKKLTNILNEDPDINNIPDNLPLDLEIDQLQKSIQHQRNRKHKQSNQNHLSIPTY